MPPLPHSDPSTLSVPVPKKGCCNQGCFDDPEYSRKSVDAGDQNDFEIKILQEEIEKLSVRERESDELEVIGKSRTSKTILERQPENNIGRAEGQAFLRLKFKELDAHVHQSDDKPGYQAYLMAREQDPVYVDDPDFKIGFLRAEGYDSQKAAHRLLLYLEEKLDLFGKEKLTHDIYWEDLGEDGWKYLEKGGLQVLPVRDSAGRRVIFLGDVLQEGEATTMLQGLRKAYFYFAVAMEKDDTEIGRVMGSVTVLWRCHKSTAQDPNVVKAIVKSCHAAPFKTSAYHFCKNKSSVEMVNAFSAILLPAIQKIGYLRLYRSHYGTTQECKYELLKYGIPDCLPIQYDVKGFNEGPDKQVPFHLRFVEEWKAMRLRVEGQKKRVKISSSAKSAPLPLDVLFDVDEEKDSDGGEDTLIGDIDKSIEIREAMAWFDSYLCSTENVDKTKSDELKKRSEELNMLDTRESGKRPRFEESKERASPELLSPEVPLTQEIRAPKLKGATAVSQHDPAVNVIADLDILPHDILQGQSPKLRHHIGNIWLGEIIDQHYSKFYAPNTRKLHKTELNTSIVKMVDSRGGRFLKPLKSGKDLSEWVEVNKTEAARIVASRFRNKRKQELKNKGS
jgi:hypothetical protein